MGLLVTEKPITRAELRTALLDVTGALLAASKAIAHAHNGESLPMYEALGEVHARVKAILDNVAKLEG